MSDHRHPIVAGCHDVGSVEYELRQLACAFEATGNRMVSDKLEGFANRLKRAGEGIRRGHEQPELPAQPRREFRQDEGKAA